MHGYVFIPASNVEMIAVYSINSTHYLLPAYTASNLVSFDTNSAKDIFVVGNPLFR